MGFFGRLPRLGYLFRLCIISIFYALGGLLVHLALPGEGTSLLGLICLFLGSGFVLLALLLWWFSTVRRFHDMNLSGWWFILAILFPPFVTLVLCFWPGTRGYNRFGSPWY